MKNLIRKLKRWKYFDWQIWKYRADRFRFSVLHLTTGANWVWRNAALLSARICDSSEISLWRGCSLVSWNIALWYCHWRHSIWEWSSHLQWATSLSIDCVKLLSTSHQSLSPSVSSWQDWIQRCSQASMGPSRLQFSPP